MATSTHIEAVARLVQVIESADRSARLVADPGLGKSRVLAQALKATRSPTRRVALVGAVDSAELFSRLAQGLGGRVVPDGSRSVAWRALAEAVSSVDGRESMQSSRSMTPMSSNLVGTGSTWNGWTLSTQTLRLA